MKCDKNAMLLYAVTDRSWLGGRSLLEDAERALAGGVTMLQLREKELAYDAFLKQAFELSALCKRYGVPFIVNDNVDIALAVHADGIHVGQSDMRAGDVRKRAGESMIIGVSAATREQAIEAEQAGADYLGVGAVFSTDTKRDASAVSHAELKAICDTVTIPVCAIGGIHYNNMKELAGTGIDGVALVSEIFAAPDICAQCKKLLAHAKELYHGF